MERPGRCERPAGDVSVFVVAVAASGLKIRPWPETSNGKAADRSSKQQIASRGATVNLRYEGRLSIRVSWLVWSDTLTSVNNRWAAVNRRGPNALFSAANRDHSTSGINGCPSRYRVASAADSRYERVALSLIDFATQTVDMDFDHVGRTIPIETPHMFAEHLTCHDLS